MAVMMPSFLSTVLYAAYWVSGARSAALVQDHGRTLSVGGITYYTPGQPEITISLPQTALGLCGDTVHLVPITHVGSDCIVSETTVQGVLSRFAASDDVWSEEFAKYLVVSGTTPTDFLASYNSSKVLLASTSPALKALSHFPSGPYIAQIAQGAVSFYRVFRVYTDFAVSFYYGVIQQADGTFNVLASNSPLTNGGTAIAVPSRLYYAAPTAEKPLSGVRVGVKDLYNLNGLKTGAGSRAWHAIYPAANFTAPSIQYLIDLGAVIVGKTRTSQFANGESPTADWVDFLSPFNARGDGYQSPSSSSAGAGSASSSYEWLDMNIGSDTGGSVRAPAAVGGLFGNRPSQHIMTLKGVVPMSAYMDTPAFVTRSAAGLAAWGSAWYSAGNSTLKRYPEFPKKLIYPIDTPGINTTIYPSPGFYPVTDLSAQALYDKFVAGLEKVLETKRTVLDFYTSYKETSGVGLYPVEQLGAVWGLMTSYEQYHSIYKPLSADWAAVNDGDQPFFDPKVAYNFEYGSNTTATRFAEAVANKTIFKDWVERTLLTPQLNGPTCSSAVIVHPIFAGSPTYRDTYPTASPRDAGIWFGWNQYSISQLAGVPEVVLPLGQVSYTSRITNTTKWLPVAVSINAAAGCDLMLYDLVAVLAMKGVIPGDVKTGSSIS